MQPVYPHLSSSISVRVRGRVNCMYRAFSHDVTADKGMAAMKMYQTNPPGIELYFYANTFFCFSNPIWLLVT